MAINDNTGTGQRTLASLAKGERGVVLRVLEAESVAAGLLAGATVGRRLLEIGFVPGETVEIVASAWPSGDPLAVRVGTAVFALRRREAESVLLQQ